MPDPIITNRPEEPDYKKLYRMLVENLESYAIFAMDPDARITSWNSGVERTLGYNEADFIGQNVSILFTPEDLEKGEDKNEQATAATTGCSGDNRWHVHRSGHRIWVEGVLTSLRDETGAIVGFSKIMHDATARKHAEEERDRLSKQEREMRTELERSNGELRQFAYVVSHDLQAPLRTINGYTELLSRELEGRKGLEFLKHIRDAATRMQTFIRDVLRYAQVIHGEGVPQTVNAESVLAGCVLNLQALVSETGAEITNDPLPIVQADPALLVQVFQNLLDNAIKYRGEKPPRIHVSSAMEGDECCFSLRDNGQGIAPEYQERIFESFKRLHGADVPGTGVGLSICKRIVERAGGRIWVHSQPGQGSTFYFTVPV